jgi:hypothetical protein
VSSVDPGIGPNAALISTTHLADFLERGTDAQDISASGIIRERDLDESKEMRSTPAASPQWSCRTWKSAFTNRADEWVHGYCLITGENFKRVW